jgi:hypothetical protein
MKTIYAVFFTAAILNFSRSEAQTITVCAFSSYTNEAKLYQSFSFDTESFRTIENIFGFGFDVRKKFVDENFIVGLSAEYLSLKTHYSVSLYDIQDEFTIVPIELSSYFSIPISSETFYWNVGGGVGLYFGTRNFHSELATTISQIPGIGIHIGSSFEYYLWENVGVRADIKFRDAQFEATNTFFSSSDFSEDNYTSEIHVDGVLLSGGIVVRF